MEEFNLENLIRLTESGEEEKAAQVVAEFFDSYSPEERGAAFVAIAAAYTKLMAQNKQELANVLESQLSELKRLDMEEKSLLDEVDLAQARNHLQT